MTTFETIVQAIRADSAAGILPSHLKELHLTPAMTLEDLGIDSLGKVELLSTLMNATHTYFPDEDFHSKLTLGEIVSMVEQAA